MPIPAFRLRIDQYSRIEQALWIHSCLGGPKGSGEQGRTLAIVPLPMVAADRMMVGDGATVLDHRIKTGRFDGVPLRVQFALSPGGMKSEIWRRAVRIDMGAATGDLAGTPSCVDDSALGRGLDLVVKCSINCR